MIIVCLHSSLLSLILKSKNNKWLKLVNPMQTVNIYKIVFIFAFSFWDYNLIAAFSLSFFSLQTLLCTPPHCPLNSCLFSSIVIACIYAYKYDLFYLYNITYIYVFRNDCLTLDCQSMCSCLGKTSSASRFPWLPIGLCVGLRSC